MPFCLYKMCINVDANILKLLKKNVLKIEFCFPSTECVLFFYRYHKYLIIFTLHTVPDINKNNIIFLLKMVMRECFIFIYQSIFIFKIILSISYHSGNSQPSIIFFISLSFITRNWKAFIENHFIFYFKYI